MDAWEGDDRIELVAERRDFLDRLADDPAHKPALVADLDTSRSTVDRAVADLEAAGLVERTSDGFRATALGRLAADRYRSFVADQRAVLDADGALAALPADADVPAALLADGDVVTSPDDPYRLYDRVLAAVRTADAVDAVLSRVGDSRPLRLCHARVLDGSLSGGLVAAPDAADRLREEFPALAADLAAASGFEVRVGETPGFELFVAREGDQHTVFLVTADADGARGLVESTASEVVDWAGSVVADAAADDSSTAFDPPAAADPDGFGVAAVDRLAADGFRHVDRGQFAAETPTDPVTAWQTGHDLVDVYYGYAFDRRTRPQDGDPESVAGALADRLAAGEHTVVVGPPGSGKSTTCRAVACRWVSDDRGPVFYRSSRARRSLDAPGRIADAAADADGHPLVVVEHAAGGVGEAALELVRQLDGEATVLLEARDSEWSALADEVADAALAELARSGVAEYRLPALDAAACERAVDAFEAATGRRVAIDPEDLVARVSRGDAGGTYLLSYHLVAHSGGAPWRRGDRAPTGLAADVRAAHDALADETGALGLEVGVLLAALVAAERPVTAGHAHAVAAARVAAGDADPVDAHGRVADALDALDGRLVFGDGDEFRTQHPYWAVQFLETALDRHDRRAVAAFERALSALFAAADPDRRERVERWLGRDAPALRALGDDPDGVVEAVFDLAPEHSTLVELFGDHARSGIDLPADCDPETELACLRDRMLAWYEAGGLDRAEAVADALADRAREADVPADTRDRYVARSHQNRGELAEQRGDTGAAREHFERAIDLAEAAGDTRQVVMALNSLGWAAMQGDDYDAAADALDRALDAGEDLPAMPAKGTTRFYRASLARRRGDLDAAEDWLQRTLDMDRDLGNDRGAASTLNELGIVAENRDAFDRAEDYYRRAIELRRETEDRPSLAKNVYNLGDLLAKRGDLAAAEDCLEEALAIADEVGMDRFRGNVRSGFGRVALERGDLDAAADYYRQSIDIYDDHEYDYGTGQSVAKLGDVARERGDTDAAVERYDRAADTLESVGVAGKAVDVLERCADALADADRRDAAVARLERAIDAAGDAGLDDRVRELRDRRGDLAPAASDD